MENGFENPGPGARPDAVPAGDFTDWLAATRLALKRDSATDVDCRDCTGCCHAAYYIAVRPEERDALARIPARLLAPAPQGPPGLKVMAQDAQGKCPMLQAGRCSIYAHRPQTCRNYDCRIFTAAEIDPGGRDKARIAERVGRWRFTYADPQAEAAHAAVRAAARFIREHAGHFPGGRIPEQPSALAVLALKVYPVFLQSDSESQSPARDAASLASAIVAASRDFDRAA